MRPSVSCSAQKCFWSNARTTTGSSFLSSGCPVHNLAHMKDDRGNSSVTRAEGKFASGVNWVAAARSAGFKPPEPDQRMAAVEDRGRFPQRRYPGALLPGRFSETASRFRISRVRESKRRSLPFYEVCPTQGHLSHFWPFIGATAMPKNGCWLCQTIAAVLIVVG